MQYIMKYVALRYGKTATFMPKPLVGDNGCGMRVHQSLAKGGQKLFTGDGYGGLSQMALWYIGGIFKHARAINAFANSATNSYKRLVPGYEAPVMLAYSASNRSASCRIPYVANPKARRIEIRFPDPMNTGYLIFAALMMAGLDGIKNQIDPGSPSDKDLYDLPPEEEKNIPTVCHSLDQALEAVSYTHLDVYKRQEPEFFIFDSVRFANEMGHVFYHVDSEEAHWNSGREYDGGNSGYRPMVCLLYTSRCV